MTAPDPRDLWEETSQDLLAVLHDLTDEDWRRVMSVDLDGAFYSCRAVLPGMIRRKYGRILLVSSMWGQTGASCEVHYSAAKAGVIGLAKALAKIGRAHV